MLKHERTERHYRTPSHIVKALLKREHFPGLVWEPAAGRGDIVMALHACGYSNVIASDSNDWGFQPCFTEDFFTSQRLVDCVLTNPPFDLKNEFLQHAKQVARFKIALLLPITFEMTRPFILGHERDAEYAWKALYSFPQAIPWLNLTQKPGKLYCGWFVFERGYSGPVIRQKILFQRNPAFAPGQTPYAPDGFVPYDLAASYWAESRVGSGSGPG